jgi:hypothetical protein
VPDNHHTVARGLDLRGQPLSFHGNRRHKAPRKWRSNAGVTLIELTISVFLTLFVVIVMGRVVLQNQRSFGWGRDKVTLQQNVTEACEWMARTVRAARTLDVVSASELRAYDESGTLIHTFRRFTVNGTPRLQQDGAALVDRKCTQFVVTPDSDTTSVTLSLELEDDSGNRVAASTRVALRNRTFEF